MSAKIDGRQHMIMSSGSNGTVGAVFYIFSLKYLHRVMYQIVGRRVEEEKQACLWHK